MSIFDSISETVSNFMSGASDQIGGAAEDVTSQIPGADQVQEVTDQAQQVKDDILPGDEQ